MASSLPLNRETPSEPFGPPELPARGPGLGEGVEDGDDLTQRPTEPGEFADDQTVAALEDVHQLVEPSALFGSLSRGGRLDEIVDAEVVFACVLEDARRWLRRSCCAVETLK